MVCPIELVILQLGPGLCHPGGVAPGVSHLFAPWEPETYGFSVMPGEKGLLAKELEPVILFVMSEIRTIAGDEHGTLPFQEPPTSVGNAVAVESKKRLAVSMIPMTATGTDLRASSLKNNIEPFSKLFRFPLTAYSELRIDLGLFDQSVHI